MSKYLTVAEVADLWGMRREAVYRLIDAGEVEAVDFSRPGARRAFYKISRESVAAFEHGTQGRLLCRQARQQAQTRPGGRCSRRQGRSLAARRLPR